MDGEITEKVKAPRIDLLELLATVLETQTRIPFDYGSYVGDDWEGDQELSCGTTACAGGIAATLPEFRKEGLYIKAFGVEHELHGLDGLPAIGDSVGGIALGTVALRGLDGLPAIDSVGGIAIGTVALAEVLGIDTRDSEYLFLPASPAPAQSSLGTSPFSDADAKTVAAHIRKYVAWLRSKETGNVL